MSAESSRVYPRLYGYLSSALGAGILVSVSIGQKTVNNMYLHIGNDISLRTRDIIIICDAKLIDVPNADTSAVLPGKEPKSAVITDKGVYLSIINAPTLKKRIEEQKYD